jgi:uncharacterized protein
MRKERMKIIYIHRGTQGNLKMIAGSSIERLEGGFLILMEGTQIPCHRIIRIEYNDKIIWKK